MTDIYFQILKTAKFPLEFSRGSESKRFAKSRKLSKQLFLELNKTNNYTDKFILSSIAKVLEPHKINVTIETNKLKTRGGHRITLEIIKSDDEYIKTAITSHVLCFNQNPTKRDKYTILHEAGHLFDSALNPKSMRCDFIKLVNKNEIYDSLKEIKEKFLGISDLKKLRKEALQTFKDIPDEYVIDALQNIRQRLKTERNQYKFGLKMMLREKNMSLEDFINEIALYFRLKFYKKLKFANKLLKERLDKVRKQGQA